MENNTKTKIEKNKTRKKPNGWGKTLKPEMVQKIKTAWLIHRNDSIVSKLLQVSSHTIAKYRKLGGWEKLAHKADERANDVAIKKAGAELADNILIVRQVKGYVLKALKKFHDSGDFVPSVSDLDKIIRLEEFIKGNPDSRPDNSVTLNQVVNNLSDKKSDELLEIIKNGEHKYKTLGKEISGPVNRLRDTGIVSPDDS